MEANIQRLIRQRTREIIEETSKQGLAPDQLQPYMRSDATPAADKLKHVKFQPPTIVAAGQVEGTIPFEGAVVGSGRTQRRRVRSPEPEPEYEPAPQKRKRAPSEHSQMVREYMKKHPGVKLGDASKAVAALRRQG